VAGDGGSATWVETGRKYQAAGVTHITIGAPPALNPAQALERLAAARGALAQALG